MPDTTTVAQFLDDVDTDVWKILSADFEVEVTETTVVPHLEDSALTYDDPYAQTKGAKRITTCVLYVDIRDSSRISAERRPQTLARMYSAFVRAMVRCARFGGGHVRNIIGDRVMVVFDTADCFEHAVRTAALCNTAAQRIINRRIENFDFRCGIGIDYGPMLVMKAGVPRRGSQTEFYRSLVWLGRPANVASKLTDVAAKSRTPSEDAVREGKHYPLTNQWSWLTTPTGQFLDSLEATYTGPTLRHKDPYFSAFYKTTLYHSAISYPPVLITEDVLAGLRSALGRGHELCTSWSRRSLEVPGYQGAIYGGDLLYGFPE